MVWHVEYLPAQQTVSVRVSGRTNIAALLDIADAAARMATKHGAVRYLADFTTASSGLSILEMYSLPLRLEKMGIRCTDRVAIVHRRDGEDSEDFGYYALLARDHGFDQQVFTDVLSAVAWLSACPPSDERVEREKSVIADA